MASETERRPMGKYIGERVSKSCNNTGDSILVSTKVYEGMKIIVSHGLIDCNVCIKRSMDD